MKDNKLIAEFMGHEFTLMPDTDGKCYTEKDSWDIIHEDDFIVDEGWYAYNTSWNRLMPVCQQIDKYLEDNISLIGYFDDCLRSNDIDVRYQAVVEFINQLDN